MLKHEQAIGDTDAQRPAGATLTDHGGQDRHPQAEHLAQIDRDRLTLALLFGQHARIGTRGVDEADDRQIEAVGMVHQAHRLAIAPR